MNRSARVFVLALVTAGAALPVTRPAHADPVADQAAAAEDLFQRASGLLAKGELDAACPLLLESYRLDPAGGTLQNLAVCYEQVGKFASAYARFQELRAMSTGGDNPRPDRVKLAEERIAKLAPRISRVVFVMPDAIAEDAEVTLDRVTYLRAAWSAGIAVDPGTHEVVVTAPGKEPFRTTVTTSNDGARQEVRVPELADEAPAAQPGGAAPSVAGRAGDAAPPATHRLRATGLVVGGAGLAVLAAGGVFGVLAATTSGAGRDLCLASRSPGARRDDFDPVTGRCYEGSTAWRDANDAKDDARTFANVANVLVPVGAIAALVGAYFIFRTDAPRGAAKTPSVWASPSLGGASIEGTF